MHLSAACLFFFVCLFVRSLFSSLACLLGVAAVGFVFRFLVSFLVLFSLPTDIKLILAFKQSNQERAPECVFLDINK